MHCMCSSLTDNIYNHLFWVQQMVGRIQFKKPKEKNKGKLYIIDKTKKLYKVYVKCFQTD